MATLLTNTWYNAAERLPWPHRAVLVRLDSGVMTIATHDGVKWHGLDRVGNAKINLSGVAYFYIFEMWMPFPTVAEARVMETSDKVRRGESFVLPPACEINKDGNVLYCNIE